tara:strand:+ start:1280 stop:2203 length:924 start_codon:yes stop_codon:yes gene_type:complete
MSDIISKLEPLSWRGLDVPCGDASYSFRQRQAERKYPYIDSAAHEWMGRDSIQFSATLYFLNTIALNGKTLTPGVESGLYPGVWEQFRETLLDGSIGTLVHPDIGDIWARVTSSNISMTPATRSGIVVQVDWVESLKSLEDEQQFVASVASDASAAAKACDVAMSLLGIDYPDGAPSTDLFGAIEQLKGIGFSLALSVRGLGNRIVGAIDRIRTFRLPGQSATVLGSNAQASALGANLDALEEAVFQLVRVAESNARPTGTKTLTHDQTLDDFATEVDNTLNEIMGLNTKWLTKSKVPSGETLTYYL